MEITKYGHACFVATKNNESIVVDPGRLSPDFAAPEHAVAVVVTHMHGDHWTVEQLRKLQGVPVYTVDDAAAAMKEAGIEATIVKPGDEISVGGFTMKFTGGEHALIHPDTPICHNVGVLINNGKVYYPGDSFADPGIAVETLALPIAAPWMKTAEGMDYLMQLKPARAFPTHDGVLSDAGKQFVDNWMRQAAEKAGTEYARL